jgi:hypothetical protein
MYNTTLMENSNTAVTFFDAVFKLKDSTGEPMYFAGYTVLLLVFVALFMTMKLRSDYVIAMLGSSFIVSIIALLMIYKEYIGVVGVIIPILLLVSSLLYVIFTKDSTQ